MNLIVFQSSKDHLVVPVMLLGLTVRDAPVLMRPKAYQKKITTKEHTIEVATIIQCTFLYLTYRFHLAIHVLYSFSIITQVILKKYCVLIGSV